MTIRISCLLACLVLAVTACAPQTEARPARRELSMADLVVNDGAILVHHVLSEPGYEAWSEPDYIGPQLLQHARQHVHADERVWGSQLTSTFLRGNFMMVHRPFTQTQRYDWKSFLVLQDRQMTLWPGATVGLFEPGSDGKARVEIRLEWFPGDRESFARAHEAAGELLALVESVTTLDPDDAWLVFPARTVLDVTPVADSREYAFLREPFDGIVFPGDQE